MASGSTTAVVAALVGNTVIAVIKFVVALVTGSAAMLAEAVHSTADTGNQFLLLLGIRRSHKPADDLHPFGYGPEQYFWSFVVANMLFFIGAVVSVYEGIDKVQHPHPVERAGLVYAILAGAFVIEGITLAVAARQFQHTRPQGIGLFTALRRTKDSNVLVVLFEDAAAIVGLAVAFVGVLLADLLGLPVLDGLASIVIGVLLAVVALLLARETKDLLIGESASRADRAAIRALLDEFPEVVGVGSILTMHRAPDRILITMDLEFRDDLNANAIEDTVDRIEARIRQKVPAAGRIFIEAERVSTTAPVRPPL